MRFIWGLSPRRHRVQPQPPTDGRVGVAPGPASASNSFSYAAAQLPEAKPEQCVLVPRTTWHRLRDEIKSLKRVWPVVVSLGSATLGVGLGLLPAAWSDIRAAGFWAPNPFFAAIFTLVGLVAVAGGLVARNLEAGSLGRVIQEMDEIDARLYGAIPPRVRWYRKLAARLTGKAALQPKATRD
jgi:hypothetical protein